MLSYPLFSKDAIEVQTVPGMLSGTYIELNQVHGKKVLVVEKETPSHLEADAMVTNVVDLTLLMRHADCQVAIFYDPVHHALGMAHAGWRGQSLGIYTEVVRTMEKEFGSNSKDLKVAMAPSLGPEKAEFKNYRNELSPWMWPYEEKKEHFNLWKIAEAEFLTLGIQREHLSLPTFCTFSDERFFSYRRNKTIERNRTAGRLVSIV